MRRWDVARPAPRRRPAPGGTCSASLQSEGLGGRDYPLMYLAPELRRPSTSRSHLGPRLCRRSQAARRKERGGRRRTRARTAAAAQRRRSEAAPRPCPPPDEEQLGRWWRCEQSESESESESERRAAPLGSEGLNGGLPGRGGDRPPDRPAALERVPRRPRAGAVGCGGVGGGARPNQRPRGCRPLVPPPPPPRQALGVESRCRPLSLPAGSSSPTGGLPPGSRQEGSRARRRGPLTLARGGGRRAAGREGPSEKRSRIPGRSRGFPRARGMAAVAAPPGGGWATREWPCRMPGRISAPDAPRRVARRGSQQAGWSLWSHLPNARSPGRAGAASGVDGWPSVRWARGKFAPLLPSRL
eukprot:scaffold406_cov391-Prasinococcus_capsulatus_cf.AAC.22